MTEVTPRLGLPFIHAGQAQKEVTHNEALQGLDLWTQSVVEDSRAAPPSDPLPGKCWLVQGPAEEDWAGKEGAVAQWTAGGWRFAGPAEGMSVWHRAQGLTLRHIGGEWTGIVDAACLRIGGAQVVGTRQPPISPPIGGAVADLECRSALAAILAALQAHGLISN